jgi:hypothetical protein
MPNATAIISLELGAAILFWLVFVVIETAVLQLINWGDFRHCLRASLIANLASALIIAISLIWIPRFGFAGLVIGGVLSIMIEGLVFSRLNPETNRRNWLAAILANLVSFLILIFPVFWIIRGMT